MTTGSELIYESKESDTSLEVRCSSTMKYVDDICTAATAFLESKGEAFTPHIFSINLVMREGLTNAVRHGNKSDPDKTIDFSLEVDTDNIIRVRIADQGEGFDWRNVREHPLSDVADHGRGMPIMKAYFSHYRYNKKGNVLFLEKLI